MTQGFDCATVLTLDLAKSFKDAGYEFVARYLPLGMWKSLSAEEVDAISQAGLNIISVFETTASRAFGGYQAGLIDGARAEGAAAEIGQPAGSGIYFAVDFEPTMAQMEMVIEYIRGCSEATPNFVTGVYGCASVIRYVQAAGVCSRFWQTYAWSRGDKVEDIQVYQYRNDIQVNDIGIDLDTGYGNEGWWNTLEPVQTVEEVEEYMMSTEDADKCIGFLGAAYGATPDPEAQEEFHRLANELRKVSGQLEE